MIVSLVGRTTSGSSSGAGRNQSAIRTRFQPMMRHDRAFLGEAFDVGRFFFQNSSAE